MYQGPKELLISKCQCLWKSHWMRQNAYWTSLLLKRKSMVVDSSSHKSGFWNCSSVRVLQVETGSSVSLNTWKVSEKLNRQNLDGNFSPWKARDDCKEVENSSLPAPANGIADTAWIAYTQAQWRASRPVRGVHSGHKTDGLNACIHLVLGHPVTTGSLKDLRDWGRKHSLSY